MSEELDPMVKYPEEAALPTGYVPWETKRALQGEVIKDQT
jgi:hypothetical protein